tara:strand:- start:167 stop:400 length:234 start_codon:yes stop_codon:yes gene_type:complete
MMTRTIKFNVKHFIEEYIYSIESKDYDAEIELLEKFNRVFYNSPPQVKKEIQAFLFNNSNAKEYKKIQDLATRCTHF